MVYVQTLWHCQVNYRGAIVAGWVVETIPAKRHRFTPETIQYAVWLYYRLCLSYPDIEGMLAERGTIVTRESIW